MRFYDISNIFIEGLQAAMFDASLRRSRSPAGCVCSAGSPALSYASRPRP